jgi:hypothetical protein
VALLLSQQLTNKACTCRQPLAHDLCVRIAGSKGDKGDKGDRGNNGVDGNQGALLETAWGCFLH